MQHVQEAFGIVSAYKFSLDTLEVYSRKEKRLMNGQRLVCPATLKGTANIKEMASKSLSRSTVAMWGRGQER